MSEIQESIHSVKLITIRSKKSFREVTDGVEALFQKLMSGSSIS